VNIGRDELALPGMQELHKSVLEFNAFGPVSECALRGIRFIRIHSQRPEVYVSLVLSLFLFIY